MQRYNARIAELFFQRKTLRDSRQNVFMLNHSSVRFVKDHIVVSLEMLHPETLVFVVGACNTEAQNRQHGQRNNSN